MKFIVQSVIAGWQQFNQQRATRASLFNKDRTPKRVFSFWFFVILLGQIGIITSLIWAWINGENVAEALAQQAKSGNFLTFEISLILSCLVYYFEEYGQTPVRDLFFLRISLLVLSMVVAFLAMLNYIYINSAPPSLCWSTGFVMYNFALYFAGVFLSYSMYITFSVVEPNVAQDMKNKTDAAIDAAKSLQETNVASVGQKPLNVGG